MLTIEIHVDTLEDKAASTRNTNPREDKGQTSTNIKNQVPGTRFRSSLGRRNHNTWMVKLIQKQ